jgi:hypothetical protein
MHSLAAPNPWSFLDRDLPRRWRWIAAGLMALALLAAFAWRATALWQDAQALAEMKPHVKLASIYVTRVLQYQSGQVEGFTVAELIRASEGGVDDIERVTAALRAESRVNPADEERAVDYLREAQSLLRDVARLARITQQVNAYSVQIDRLEQALASAGSVAQQQALGAELVIELRDIIDVLKDGQATARRIGAHLDYLASEQPWVHARFGDDAAIPMAVLDQARSDVARSLGNPRAAPDDAIPPTAGKPWREAPWFETAWPSASCKRVNLIR